MDLYILMWQPGRTRRRPLAADEGGRTDHEKRGTVGTHYATHVRIIRDIFYPRTNLLAISQILRIPSFQISQSASLFLVCVAGEIDGASSLLSMADHART